MKKLPLIFGEEFYLQKILTAMLLALVLSFLLVQVVFADIELHILVTDCTGQPVEGALVEVLTSNTNIGGVRQAITDSEGKATVNPVRPGPQKHTIRVTKDNYTSQEITQYMEAWTTHTIEVKLIPISGSCESPPVLTKIEVTPPDVILNLNGLLEYRVEGYDENGDAFPIQATWSATGGNIDIKTGLYTATTAGTFTVTASVQGSTVTGTATVHVNPPELAKTDVTPVEVTLNIGDQPIFTAKGHDKNGNEIPLDVYWSATGGDIDSKTGVYTATTAGTFTVTASVQGSTVTGTATVHVNPPELAKTDVTPVEVTLNVGDQPIFTAKGYDKNGNEIPLDAYWSATGGNIDSKTGVYTATTAGTFTVTASVQGSTVTGTASVSVQENMPPWWAWTFFGFATLYVLGFTSWWLFFRRGALVPWWIWLLFGIAGVKFLGTLCYFLGIWIW